MANYLFKGMIEAIHDDIYTDATADLTVTAWGITIDHDAGTLEVTSLGEVTPYQKTGDTGIYHVYKQVEVLYDSVYFKTHTEDENFQDATVLATLVDANVWSWRERALTSFGSLVTDIWTGLTSAAKAAIAAAVWVYTGGRTVTNTGVITVVSPVDVDTDRAQVRRGFDYYVADNNYLGWSSTDWPDLTGATAVILEHAILGNVSLTVVDAGETTQTVQVAALTATQTSSLKLGFSDVQLKATLASGHVVDLGSTKIHVVD